MKKWTQFEIDNTIKLLNSGMFYKDISKELKKIGVYRTYKSIECFIRKLGLNGNKRYTQRIKSTCLFCKKEFYSRPLEDRKFCSQKCSCTHQNLNKKYGVRRSKLEFWLEEKLNLEYPNLEILFNNKDTINSELDIYIPNLKLAFELNGIFHYEPIYGEDKLKQILNNDDRKFQACLEKGIELCIIDTSKLNYFKIDNCFKYFDIIKNIIDKKLIFS